MPNGEVNKTSDNTTSEYSPKYRYELFDSKPENKWHYIQKAVYPATSYVVKVTTLAPHEKMLLIQIELESI